MTIFILLHVHKIHLLANFLIHSLLPYIHILILILLNYVNNQILKCILKLHNKNQVNNN
jgi:hypothetical protein